MGRDVAGLRFEKKPSNVVNLKSTGEKNETNVSEADDHHAVQSRLIVDQSRNKKPQDLQQVKSTNNEPDEIKIVGDEAQKSTTDKKSSSTASCSSAVNANSLEPDKHASSKDDANGDETNDSLVKPSPQSNDLHSPRSTKKSQNFQNKKYYDDEDNCSLASSTATSVRTIKSKVTVPVAPKFTCADRLERRKEFYSKLEEKHRALEKEKLENEARIREEEQAAIKQLRKSMVYKANPVPSFYREGPPPKVELKKLPLTRAKSPKLTRRKSCGDAVKTCHEDKELDQGQGQAATRRSVSINREDNNNAPISTPKGKDRIGPRKFNEHSKGIKNQATKEDDDDDPPQETTENPCVDE